MSSGDDESEATSGRTRWCSGPPRRMRSTAFSDRYERSLGRVLHHARPMTIVALVLVGAGVLAYRFVETGFLPEMDEGAFVLDYTTPGGTALAETDRQLHIVEKILASTPEITGTSRRTGAELGLFATEQNTGDIVARLEAAESARPLDLRRHRRRPREGRAGRAAHAHRVRPDPLRRHQRPRRRGEPGRDPALRSGPRAARGVRQSARREARAGARDSRICSTA